MSGTTNCIFLLSLGSLGACDDSSSVPACNPERLGRACNDVDDAGEDGVAIDSNTSGASGSGASDTFDSQTSESATASASASDGRDPDGSGDGDGTTTGYDSGYATTGYDSGYATTGYGSSGSSDDGSSGYGSTGYYAAPPDSDSAAPSACLSGLDCGELSEVQR